MGNFCGRVHNIGIKSKIKVGQDNLKDFIFIKKLKGSRLSNIWVVYSKNSKTLRTVKIIDKVKICQSNCQELPINQQKILLQLKHQFIANIISAFQDKNRLYLFLEYMPYGNLRDYLSHYGTLSEENTRFVAKCIFIALQYIHSKGIAHLDIKPQNIVIDQDRYFRLCDFNLSQEICSWNNGKTIQGTVGYEPPQKTGKKSKLGFEADYYSSGVVLYQLLTGKNIPAPRSINIDKITEQLLRIQNISQNCIDFLVKLLQKDPKKRLGSLGTQQILQHAWLSSDENKLKNYEQKAEPSFIRHDYINRYGSLQEMIENSGQQITINDDQDEIVRSVHIQDPRFQKIFENFKNISEFYHNS